MVLSMALVSTTLLAQTVKVSGKVSDNIGPAVGVSVLEQGTSNGTISDLDGFFALNVKKGAVLEVSSIGYKTQYFTVSGETTGMEIVLEVDNELLDEVVVVGYGTQKKVNLTGAITSVDSKELENRSTHNLSVMLQGSVPGLNVSTSAGNPGSTGSLNIRGFTSINGASPLVLIDGSVGDLDRVNSNDVESISVIKDAAAAAVYGARAAYGVILVTTKSGSDKGGKATVKYSGHFGFEEPTTSTDYETRGYWSVYTVDTFWATQQAGTKYTTYTEADMAQLLARVNDKTENPDRPWVVTDFRNGRNQWVYYANTDWWHEMYVDQHPVQKHNVSVSGGNKDVRYFISGGYDEQTGIIKQNPDVFQKYNIRSKIDAKLNNYMRLSNNTSYYSSEYAWVGSGSVQNAIQYSARHALASFPLKNPDGSWLYATPMISGNYNVANGRHIVLGTEYDKNSTKKNDFNTTTELRITPFKGLQVVANYTYRLFDNKSTARSTNFAYRQYPDAATEYYTTGAGQDELSESITTYVYKAANAFATYENTFANHHVTLTAGMNAETQHNKSISATGQNLLSETLNDLNLVGPDATGNVITTVGGGQTEYALLGFFGRLNYDYAGRYLFEVSGRYDGTSRFATGHKWGFFPSASFGWRVSEEPWFAGAKQTVNNLKFRASLGTLGNQNVSNFAYLRQISISDFAGYSFGEGTTMSKYAGIGDPKAGDLTWETSYQYNVGIDAAMLNNKLEFTAEAYIRDTKNMLVDGDKLPGVYGAGAPQSNSADLRTRGYELSLSWRDQVSLFGKPFGYFVKASMSDYDSHITKYKNNPNNLLSTYYEGMRIGDLWGFQVDGLFQSDEEAAEYMANECNLMTGNLWSTISNRMVGGFRAGDLKYVDLDGDHVLTYGLTDMVDENGNPVAVQSLKNHGDLVNLGNTLASLQYGITLGFDYLGFDFQAFFQGTGNHVWYPDGFNYAFWGPYGYSYASFIPYNFYQDMVWTPEHTDAYFPRPRAYSTTGGELSIVNSYYLQNVRYLRLKNLTFGYTVPKQITNALKLEKVRVYFSGENLQYWSPIKKITKYLDPESSFSRASASFMRASGSSVSDHMAYPWQRSLLLGVDITF